MALVLEERPVARPRGRPKTSARDDVTVKIDRRLKGIAENVATYRGTNVAALLSELLEHPLELAYLQMMRDLERKRKGGE